jgi:tRNA pseudouridine32 synthase/23S rRNA pseudouridine746 synthase
MLIAHSKSMARFLSNLFEQHAIYKAYVAKVQGMGIKVGACALPIDDKQAVSHIHLLGTNANNSLVKVEIETGRKHQIRIHLASLGHPIVGDRQRHPGPHTEDLALACSELAWTDAKGTERQYSLPQHLLPTL